MSGNTSTEIDEIEAQRQFDTLLDQVERGAGFIITRQGKAVARLVHGRPVAGAVMETRPIVSG